MFFNKLFKPNDKIKSRLLSLVTVFYAATINQKARWQTMDRTLRPTSKDRLKKPIRNWMRAMQKGLERFQHSR